MNSYKKFTDGTWGVVVRSETVPSIGYPVVITTRKGREKTEFIAAIRSSVGSEHTCDIAIGQKPSEIETHETDAPEATPHEANGFDSMSVVQLRAAVRARGITTSAVASATREALLETLRTGILPIAGTTVKPSAPAVDLASALSAAMSAIASQTTPALPENRIREIAREEQGDLREYVEGRLSEGTGKVDEARVRAIVREEQAPPSVITVKVASLPEVQLPRQHYKFPLLLACAANGVPAYLVGERGSGKTTVGHAVAKALGRQFGSMSCGIGTSKSDIMGFMAPQLTGPPIYQCPDLIAKTRDGGVMLLDELDLCHAGSLAQANSIFANGQFGCPNGMITKHPDFYPMAGGNTYGHGATTRYKGRQGLDGATLDRFAVITWDYDPQLENIAAGLPPCKTDEIAFDLKEGGIPDVAQWVKIVRQVRKDALARDLITDPSPRASEYGAKLARAGVGYRWLREMFLVRGFENMEQITPKSL